MFVGKESAHGRELTASRRKLGLQGSTLGYGRFMQTDPIGYADGLNMYDYGGGDPVNNTDPSGLAGNDIVVNAPSRPPSINPGSPVGLVSSNNNSSTSIDPIKTVVKAAKKVCGWLGICKNKKKPKPIVTVEADDSQDGTLTRFVNGAACGLASFVPGNRIRLGGDAAFGLGGIIGGGSGVSLEDSGRVVFDAYGTVGPGLGGIAGAGLTVDSNSTADGWSSSKSVMVQGAYGLFGGGYSNSNGVENGGGIISIGPKAGFIGGYTLNVSHGTTLYNAQCR